MILGLGNDVIDIRRIERTIELYGDRFLNRIFTETERAKSDRRRERAASYAKRFAAKEACSKALGTGLRKGVFWRDMGVVNLPSGRPTLKLTGGAAAQLAHMQLRGAVSAVPNIAHFLAVVGHPIETEKYPVVMWVETARPFGQQRSPVRAKDVMVRLEASLTRLGRRLVERFVHVAHDGPTVVEDRRFCAGVLPRARSRTSTSASCASAPS